MSLRTLIVTMGLVGLMTVPAFAGSVKFDFVFFASAAGGHGGEHGAVQEDFTLSGLTVTASARNLANNNVEPYNMYLDDLAFNGKDGGLGVCKVLLLLQCDPSSDDNLTLGEVLVLKFDQLVTITEITFSNGDHEDVYSGLFGLAIDPFATPTTVGEFDTSNALTDVFTPGVPLTPGMEYSFIAPATVANANGEPDTQMYISTITVTTVPEPSSLFLLGFGLLAGGVTFRKSFK